MSGKNKINNLILKLNQFVKWVDSLPLGWVGFLMLLGVFTPLFVLGNKMVFTIHDQLDETVLSYVFYAKYMGSGSSQIAEILGGINKSGMQPSAFLFVPLYRFFSARTAFLIQYGIVFMCAFFGMYLATHELTGSGILSVTMAGCFCMLPLQPVYGLSAAGVPLLFWCYRKLCTEKYRLLCFFIILLYGYSTHLVLSGYAVLGIWALAIGMQLLQKKIKKWSVFGFLWLTAIYLFANRNLFLELLFGDAGYVSHRTEQVNSAAGFVESVKELFLYGTQHTNSLHRFLIIPIVLMLLLGGIFYKNFKEAQRRQYLLALSGFALLVGTAVFYGLCKWEPIVELKNQMSGFLHYFQMDRFYWLAPAVWYLEFGLCFSLWWNAKLDSLWGNRLLQTVVLCLVLLPTLQEIKVNSYLYMNVNQYNNGSEITGYISWESFYAEDVMQAIEEEIGREKDSYRVVSLGISPAPILMHGFYTIDGYSNNYPLEYKHRFRKIIEKELDKAPDTAVYFDDWGNRCYLFNAETGTAWMLGKNVQPIYHNLEFDMDAMKELGCEYILSAGIIENAEELDMTLLGYYESDTSYWGIWLYKL